MRRIVAVTGTWAAVALVATTAAAEDTTRVEVRVTYASGDSVYLDRGRDDGLEVGDRVTLEDATHGRREAELVAVSGTTSRAQIKDGRPLPQPGTSGQVVLPPGRTNATPPTGPADEGPKRAPDHPEWTRPPEERDPDAPLLAPAFSINPWERPLRIRGRAHATALSDVEHEADGDSRHSFYETGLDLDIRNLFGRGGRLGFSGDLERRVRDVGDDGPETEEFGRVDRLFYRWGEGVDAPLVATLGRFVPRDTPELGLVDGIEASVRAGRQNRVTVDLGALPEPSAQRSSFDDRQASLAWRWVNGDDETVATTLAFQQTWHKGDRDRRLVLGKIDWSPHDDVSLHGDVWVDLYDSADVTKSGSELTEAHVSGTWRVNPDHGLRASWSQNRWPELLRDEFPLVARRFLDDRRVTRADVGGWHRLGEHVRVDERIGTWSDQDESGVTADVTGRFPNLIVERNEPYARVFRIDGSFESGVGVRVGDRHHFDGVSFGLAYETSRTDLDGGGGRRTRSSVLATVDITPAPDWSLGIEADSRFGDDQDGLSIAVYLDYRF